jgi:RNA polymerase sigma factor (sigma-70 family)
MSEGTLTAPRPQRAKPLLRLVSDARLARLAAQGSQQAFATIYERHHQEIYRYCRSILGNEHDARDALQNTMLKALRALEGETRDISLRPWLFRIAHNESISLLRRRTPEASIDAAAEVVAVEADPETRQRLRDLIADLDQLAPRQRSALVMRELSGLEFDEIGVALETSPAAAKQAVYEARTALHELEEGREVSCEEIRRKISAEDRRLLRGRKVRAHMKACADCRTFEQLTRERSGQLAALAPPLPLPIALGILEGILGGGGGGGIAALLGGGGGVAGLGGATAAKLGIAGALVLGVGAAAVKESSDDDTPKARAAPAVERSAASAPQSKYDAGSGARQRDDGSSNGGGATQRNNDGGSGHRNNGGDNAGVAAANGHGAAPPAPATPGNDISSDASSGSNGGGPASAPPGQGGTPPGQGGVPPGLGAPPPGHGGPSPGNSASAPGQTGTAPGLGVALPPGQGGIPPGQGGQPPGHGGGK